MRRPTGELLAVLLTGATFQVFETALGLKIPFLIAVTLAWGVYCARRVRARPMVLTEWGLGRRGLAESARLCAIVFGLGLPLLASWRLWDGWIPLPANSVAIFVGYPLWALIQEFVVQGLVVVNLERLGWPRAAVVAVAAILFGLAHFPDLPLMGLCSAAGLLWCPIFLRSRNLWPIALCHAWLGALAFYWVLERDPLREMVPA